jgi:hypothetical protein
MIICEFCLNHTVDGRCRLGLKLPKGMSCHDFQPGIQKFCSDPKDFIGQNQIIQMATFFGLQKKELKKVRQMAVREEIERL